MQNLFYDQAPYHILYYDAELDAYRTDKFAGWQNQPTDGGTPLFVIRHDRLHHADRWPRRRRPSPSSAAPSAGASSSAAAERRRPRRHPRLGRGQRLVDQRQHDADPPRDRGVVVVIAVGARAHARDATRQRTSRPATARAPTVTARLGEGRHPAVLPADPGGRDGRRATSLQQGRPGVRDDLPDRPAQLRPVPDDAGLARAGPAAQPARHRPRSATRPARAGASTSRSSRTSSSPTSARRRRATSATRSSSSGQPVADVLAGRLWPTIILFGLGEVIAIVFGLALGAYAGWKRGGAVDYVGNGVSLILYSMPYFVIGMLMLIIFATGLGWFPTSGCSRSGRSTTTSATSSLDFARHLVLPLIDGRARAHRPVLDPHALVGHRDRSARTTSRPPAPRA